MQTENIVEEVMSEINLRGVSVRFENVTLEQVAAISAGQSAPKDSFFSEKNGKPFIRAGHLQELIISSDTNSLPKISNEDAKLLKLKLLKCGSILFAKSGMSATLNRVYQIEEDSYYVSHLAAITANESRLNSKYCKYFLQNFKPSQLIKDSAYPSIGLSDINKIQIPLPSLATQKRIAEILDKADTLRKKDQQLLKHYDMLAQSLFIEMFGDPVKNETWKEHTIEDLALKNKGSMRTGPFGSDLLHSEFVDSGIRVLGIDNVVNNSFEWAKFRFITEEKYEKLRRYTVYPGDVLVSIMATTGRCAVVPDDISKAINTKHLAAITLNLKMVSPVFLCYSIHSDPKIVHQLTSKNRGAIMDGLNLGIIKKIRLKLPPLEHQEHFVKMFRNIEEQKEKLKSQIQASESLFQTLLQKAFNGTLN